MPGDCVEKTFTVQNELGLHLRAAGKLAQTAGKFPANIWIKKENVEINGKSIMGILSLAAANGSEITVRCQGPDSDKALAAIEALIESKFGEQ